MSISITTLAAEAGRSENLVLLYKLCERYCVCTSRAPEHVRIPTASDCTMHVLAYLPSPQSTMNPLHCALHQYTVQYHLNQPYSMSCQHDRPPR